MDFLIAGIIGQPHLADTRNAKGVQKAVNALRHQVGMVDGESPTETLRGYGVKVVPTFRNRMGQVVDFRIGRLKVQVFQQQRYPGLLGIGHSPLQPRQRRRHPLSNGAAEMVAAMDYHAVAAQPPGQGNVAFQVAVNGIIHIGRKLGDIDRRGGVQSQGYAVPAGGRSNRCHPRGVPIIQAVRPPVGVEIQVEKGISRRRGQGILKAGLAGIIADTIFQGHS